MVAFVLVLLAIAMITTVTMLATRIQKQTKDSQQRMTQLAEAAYQQLQPVYNETEQSWKIQIPAAAVSNEFDVDVKTADWTVSVASDSAVQTTYHIYRQGS